MLWNVRELGLTGSKVERVLELASITTNKNSIQGDTSALNPGGVRLGTPALTTRGFDTADFDQVAEFLHRGSEIAKQAETIAELELAAKEIEIEKSKKAKVLLKDFLSVLYSNQDIQQLIQKLKFDVEEFASDFYMP